MAVAACSAGNNAVDPGDLALRDVLGLSPEIAIAWDGAQREAARRVLEIGLREDDAASQAALVSGPGDLDGRIAALLAANDAARASDGAGPLGVVRVAIDPDELVELSPRPAPLTGEALGDAAPPHTAATGVELWLAEPWNRQHLRQLPGRAVSVLSRLAIDAGHPGGPVVVVPAPRLAVIAAYVRTGGATAPPRLVVNPVAIAALEPISDEAGAIAAIPAPPPTERRAAGAAATAHHGALAPIPGSSTLASAGGNPYSFYGSVAECAASQRIRCEACVPAGTCRPITNITDGNAECTMLGASGGRGYFLLCINLSLAIASIDRCTGDAAPACVRDPRAADSLATLENNASFLSEPTCGGALDACLAKIFGAPGESFPGLDAGTSSGPPRSTSVSCSNSCDDNRNTSCNASPSCDCSGPSCNNSLSCDSACSSSNDQGGCGGDCNACTSSGGDSGNSGGGCGSGGSSASGNGCSGGGGSSSCGSGCSGSGGGGGCGGGSCSGGSCGGSGGSSCGGGGGGGKCNIAGIDPAPGVGLAMSVMWGTLPVVLAALTRRRARRRRWQRDVHREIDVRGDAGTAAEAADVTTASTGERGR